MRAPIAHGLALAALLAGCESVLALDEYHERVCPAAAKADDAVVRACILNHGCTPFYPNTSLSDCVTFDTLSALGGPYECSRAAKKCSDIERCLGQGFATSAMCGTSTGAKCSGTRAVDCSGGWFVDCSVIGGTCAVVSPGSGQAARPACKQLSSCPTTTSGCKGSVSYTCLGGQAVGTDCARSGGTCRVESGTAGCYVPLPSCDAAGVSCDGKTLRVCTDAKEAIAYACGPQGMECAMSGTDGYCLQPGCTVEQAKACRESCTDQATIRLCVGGAPLSVPCSRFGLSRCREFDDTRANAPLGHFALCLP